MTHKRIRIIVWPLPSPNQNIMNSSSSSSSATAIAANTPTKSMNSSCHCCCVVTKFMRKLLVKSVNRSRRRTTSRQSSFQCRYDPLSYSLNFEEQDYYKFSAFSSRFLANPSSSSSSTATTISSTHPLPLEK
ncbi:hypothetical protein HN51_014209 [Arachis hypogaea]|nr:uncharacterized protein DS421_3g104490 [Arachis hypogaea]